MEYFCVAVAVILVLIGGSNFYKVFEWQERRKRAKYEKK
jgi:hypothetical protein